jgi:8-oxo-dGTP pyrophosphatase MutT (NUDIX family)
MPHIHDKIDFTAEVFVVYRDKVLMRLHEKYGIWLSVGGHIELDEDPNQAAIREVKEEVGLDIELYDTREYFGYEKKQELIAPVSVNRHRINDTHEHVSFQYFARSSTDVVIPEKETDVWKWCTLSDLDALNLDPQVSFYARKALQVLT